MSVLTMYADRFAATIIGAIRREFPNAPRHVMHDADDRPTPREAHPAFYGCFDWHSAVEMHWALVMLIRAAPRAAFVPDARAVLDEHLTQANLRTEADYFERDPAYERPYGWGWTLQLVDELEQWAASGDSDAAAWARNIRPLAEVIEAGFVSWLPKPAYPDRTGLHGNSAFAMSRALPWGWRRAEAGASALRNAIADAAGRWYGADERYSSAFEPGGADFLSPTLTEIVLMFEVFGQRYFDDWYARFLGGNWLPYNLLKPARVTDAEDGQGAHLHGLNIYRVHGLREVQKARQSDPDEALSIEQGITLHTNAAAQALSAGGWMAEHWLTAYAVLAFR